VNNLQHCAPFIDTKSIIPNDVYRRQKSVRISHTGKVTRRYVCYRGTGPLHCQNCLISVISSGNTHDTVRSPASAYNGIGVGATGSDYSSVANFTELIPLNDLDM
jgi:hypothetical protein